MFGLNGLRGVGGGAIEQIIANRPYHSFQDFLNKNLFTRSEVKKGAIVGLIKSGAFDDIDPDRIKLTRQYQSTRPKREREQKPLTTEQDLIDPEKTILRWEKEVMGLYLSSHPLESFEFPLINEIKAGAIIQK